jgi:hypothetical protein
MHDPGRVICRVEGIVFDHLCASPFAVRFDGQELTDYSLAVRLFIRAVYVTGVQENTCASPRSRWTELPTC